MKIEAGFPDADRATVATLYWGAFGGKLGFVMGPEERGVAFTQRVLDPCHAICALDDDGTLLGVAGFKTIKGALVGGEFDDLRAVYGTFGGRC